MKRPFGHVSIKRKLQVLILLTSSIALLSSCLAFFANDVWNLRARTAMNLSVIGEVLGSNSTAALTFEDRDAAGEVLGALRAESKVDAALLCDERGNKFARYEKVKGIEQSCGTAPRHSGWDRL